MNRGAGAGGGTPPAQLGGLGERCKLPQRGLGLRPRRQRFFIISCSKHYIKLRAKREIVYFFMNQIIQKFTCTIIRIAGSMYYNRMLGTVFWDMLACRFHLQVLFLYSARIHGNQSRKMLHMF